MVFARIAACALTAAAAFGSADAQTAPFAIFERIDSLSVDEFTALLDPVVVSSKSGGRLRVWVADNESGRERKDRRVNYGIVAADSDFTGEHSVVMRVWALPDVVFLEPLSGAASKDAKLGVVAFGPHEPNCAGESQLACAQSLSYVQIDSRGNVSANGAVVGKVLK